MTSVNVPGPHDTARYSIYTIMKLPDPTDFEINHKTFESVAYRRYVYVHLQQQRKRVRVMQVGVVSGSVDRPLAGRGRGHERTFELGFNCLRNYTKGFDSGPPLHIFFNTIFLKVYNCETRRNQGPSWNCDAGWG